MDSRELPKALCDRLTTEAVATQGADALAPLARDLALIQRALLDLIPPRFAAFRESLEGPIETVERVAREGFRGAPSRFGQPWRTTRPGEESTPDHVRRIASTIEDGHLLLSIALDRARGLRADDPSIGYHAESFVRDAVEALGPTTGAAIAEAVIGTGGIGE